MALLEQLPSIAPRYVALLLLGLVIARLLVNKYGSGLDSIAGPFIAGFTNLWRVFNTSFSNPTEDLVRLHRKFNSHFVRLGPRVVSVSDPDLISTIYGINTEFRKTEFYSIIDLWHKGKFTHSLFECRDEEYHARIRRPIANAYSMTTVMEFEPAVDSTVELLMSKLDQFAASRETFPLEKWLQYYTFDVL
jgi:cytochrome P450